MEKTEKFINAEVEKAKPYSLEELREEKWKLDKKLSRDVIFLNPQREKEREEKEPAITQEFLENLIKEKERFKYVFETERESVYFVLPTGESWRFKQTTRGFDSQPIITKIFFLDAKNMEDLHEKMGLKIRNFEKEIINQKIETTKLKEGVFPVEFGVLGHPEVLFEEGENYIKIIGTKEKTREGEAIIPRFVGSGWHFGHAVTNIIKG